MMKTAKGTRRWPSGRRRRRLPLLTEPQLDTHAEISPVWEVQRDGHREVGARDSVLRRDANLRRGLATADVVLGVRVTLSRDQVRSTPGASGLNSAASCWLRSFW